MSALPPEVARGLVYGPDPAHRLDLYRPPKDSGDSGDGGDGGDMPPAVLSIRGGGWREGRRDDPRMVALVAEPLARRGYAVAAIDYRHAPSFVFPAQLDDVRRAAAWLRRQGPAHGVRGEPFGAVGGSAGGHLAALLATAAADDGDFPRPAAAVCLLAPYDLRLPRYLAALAPAQRPAMRKVLEELIGTPWARDPGPWRDASPRLRISAMSAPCFVLHGAEDEVVPAAQARRFVAALERAGVAAEHRELAGLGHDIDAVPALRPALDRALEDAWRFLDRHLRSRPPDRRPGRATVPPTIP